MKFRLNFFYTFSTVDTEQFKGEMFLFLNVVARLEIYYYLFIYLLYVS